jgi:glycosyltransferase involved in cell wall biosynthesis
MKLLFVTGSLVHGGAERHTITLANRLAERGHEVRFAYVKADHSQLERLRGVAGVDCLDARRYLEPRSVSRLGSLLKQTRPNAVVAANPYAMLYASLALRASGVAAPLAVTYHTTVPQGAKSWLQMLYYRPLFWSVDRLVFVCEAQRRYWRRRGVFGRSTQVIYNGIDTEHWCAGGVDRPAMRRALGYAEDDFVVAMSAVLRAEKNHVQMVDAIAMLRRRGLPARALFIGDGPTRAAVEARARAAGVADSVLVTGFLQDVRPLLAACDAAALCSTAVETFSLAALEAMALEKPVVHSAVGGAAEMIRPWREGLLFPAGDTRALADCLAALTEAPLRSRMGAQARRTVEELFAERAMVERYEAALTELASTRSQREQIRRSAAAH